MHEILENTRWINPTAENSDLYVIYFKPKPNSLMHIANYKTVWDDLLELAPEHVGVGNVTNGSYILLGCEAPQKALDAATDMLLTLDEYPVLCEDAYNVMVDDAIDAYWELLEDGSKEHYGRDELTGCMTTDAYDIMHEILTK